MKLKVDLAGYREAVIAVLKSHRGANSNDCHTSAAVACFVFHKLFAKMQVRDGSGLYTHGICLGVIQICSPNYFQKSRILFRHQDSKTKNATESGGGF